MMRGSIHQGDKDPKYVFPKQENYKYIKQKPKELKEEMDKSPIQLAAPTTPLSNQETFQTEISKGIEDLNTTIN